MNEPIISADSPEAAAPADEQQAPKKSSIAAAIKALRERFAAGQIKTGPKPGGAFGSGRRSNHVAGWKRVKE
jgi:hypothetical protein